jgi:hypothetical protein
LAIFPPNSSVKVAGRRVEVETDMAALRTELEVAIADLRSELRQFELRLSAKLEATKADILNRLFGLILGTLVVNIITNVGAIFAVAKLVGY